jgi:threonine dehydrogenase-like Zn-dependent dehydrogenase
VAGYHEDPRTVDMRLWNWRGIDVVNAHERDVESYARGMREAVEAVADGRIELDGLITHRLPLTRLDEALDLLRSRPHGFLKAVAEP